MNPNTIVLLLFVLLFSSTAYCQITLSLQDTTTTNWFLPGGNDPYMSPHAVNYVLSPIPSTSYYTLTYTFNGQTLYLGSQMNGGAWQFWNTAGPSASYNQLTVNCVGVGKYTIYSYATGYYLSGQNTMYGPYLNWYTPQAVWSAWPDTSLTFNPPVPATSPVRQVSGSSYWNTGGNAYLGSSPVTYTFTPIVDTYPQAYTIKNGAEYVSGNPNDYDWQTGVDAWASFLIYGVPAYSTDRRVVYIQNIGAQQFNGYGWLCAQSTPYGPYMYYQVSPCPWNLTAGTQ